VEEVVDASDEVAFEAADGFFVGLGVAALFGDLDRGPRVVEDFGEREHVERVVELTVPAGIEAVAVGPGGMRPGSERIRRSARAARRW
jgi:hypothetical protein